MHLQTMPECQMFLMQAQDGKQFWEHGAATENAWSSTVVWCIVSVTDTDTRSTVYWFSI